MIRIVREELPAELNNRLSTLTTEIAGTDPEQRVASARKVWDRTSTRQNVHRPLTETLRRMAAGLSRCMYCGESRGTAIDHFEPIARKPLRTFDWLNHLLACSHCNTTKKGIRFPLDNEGRPLLIDPTAEDPFDHLALLLAVGQYDWRTEKGRATIELFGLNDEPLPMARLNARTNVESCLLRWAAEPDAGRPAAMHELIRTVSQEPCAEVCQAMLRQAAGPGARIIFRQTPQVLAVLCLPEIRTALLR
jgi:5-methylcytosine-specific restriction endonuclease McrA